MTCKRGLHDLNRRDPRPSDRVLDNQIEDGFPTPHGSGRGGSQTFRLARGQRCAPLSKGKAGIENILRVGL